MGWIVRGFFGILDFCSVFVRVFQASLPIDV